MSARQDEARLVDAHSERPSFLEFAGARVFRTDKAPSGQFRDQADWYRHWNDRLRVALANSPVGRR